MDYRLKSIKYFVLVIIINTLFALPRFALEQGASCVSCHVNPTGGGMRNDYGSNVYALSPEKTDDNTTMLAINSHQPWDKVTDDHQGRQDMAI